MLGSWQDGRSKLFVTWKLLQLRKKHPQLFARGDYEPLQLSGDAKDHVLAFARKDEGRCVTVVLSRWAAKLMKGELAPPIGAVWGDTTVSATPRCSLQPMTDLFTGKRVAPGSGDAPALRVAELFESLPFAVLLGEGDMSA
jgi:(1->4)-alpha-D-glucan 1-alpha-D-glucosylmutase